MNIPETRRGPVMLDKTNPAQDEIITFFDGRTINKSALDRSCAEWIATLKPLRYVPRRLTNEERDWLNAQGEGHTFGDFIGDVKR
jgi:hypothetical protein